jgi:phosphoglycerol transferase MdoB-like AlkP superfamily enzyme
MPCLGFDEFHGLEAFAGAERSGLYVRDIEAARWTAARLAAGEGPLFVFVITMENHGPWTDEPEHSPCVPGLRRELQVPGFRKYLSGLRAADALISPIVGALQDRGDGVLGFYGDHKPSLPLEGSSDTATDYAIWRVRRATPPARIDLEAHSLADDLLAAAGLL